MLEQNELFNPRLFDSSVDVIFGIGQGYLKSSLSGYQQQRDEYNFLPPQQEYYF